MFRIRVVIIRIALEDDLCPAFRGYRVGIGLLAVQQVGRPPHIDVQARRHADRGDGGQRNDQQRRHQCDATLAIISAVFAGQHFHCGNWNNQTTSP